MPQISEVSILFSHLMFALSFLTMISMLSVSLQGLLKSSNRAVTNKISYNISLML